MYTSPQRVALAVLLAALAAPAAAAGDDAAASALFDEGKTLFAAGRFREARDKLAASYQLSQLSGTAGLLAACHERTGQLASAWARYRDSAVLAERSGNRERAAIARAKAADLEPRLARLQIDLPAAPPGPVEPGDRVVVTRNGEPVPVAALGVEVPVDAGRHVLVATVPGHARWTTTVEISDGQHRTVVIPDLSRIAAVAGERRTATRVRLGLGLIGVGGAAAIAGGGLGIAARNRWNDAKAAGCTEDGSCPDARSSELARTAGHRADLATGLIAVGLAAAATGLFVYWSAPRGGVESGSSAGISAAFEAGRLTIALEGGF